MNVGGIILCGGGSRRMGRPKELLPFGDETMLERVVGIVSSVCQPVVIVAGPDTELPELDTLVARDPVEGRGPLQGLAIGLQALQDLVEAAFVTSCDVPLIQASAIRAVIDSLGEADIAAVREEDQWHPMMAVYRTSLCDSAQRRVGEGKLRMIDFLEALKADALSVDLIREGDPELQSLMNVNTPKAYEQVLRLAGFC